MPDERLAGFRQPDRVVCALEQHHPALALERGQVLGDGRRRIAERLCRAADRAAERNLPEDLEPADVQHAGLGSRGLGA